MRKLLQTILDSKAFVLNGNNLIAPILSPSPLRSVSIPLFAHFARKYARASLSNRRIKKLAAGVTFGRKTIDSNAKDSSAQGDGSTKPFRIDTPLGWLDEETLVLLISNFEAILTRTPAQAARDPNATNLFSVLSGPAKPSTTAMNDVDGQPSRAFFSVLLDNNYLSEEQVSHHALLLSLENLLNNLFEPLIDADFTETSEKFKLALTSLFDAIYKYIARVMDQIKFCQQLELKALTGVSAPDPNAFFQLPTANDAKELRDARLSRGTKYPDLLQTICLRVTSALCRLDNARIESCWTLLSRSCLAMSGVESNFAKFAVPKKETTTNDGLSGDIDATNAKESGAANSKDNKASSGAHSATSFGTGPLHSQNASFLSNWHSSLGVPAGLILGFSTAFFYPATCSALFFAPHSLLNFGTSPERMHSASALHVLSFVMDHLLFAPKNSGTQASKNHANTESGTTDDAKSAHFKPALYDLFCLNNGILPFSVEFLFRSYFDSFLSLYYQDPVVAHDTIKWLQRYAPYLNGSAMGPDSTSERKFVPPLRLSTHINMYGQHLTFFECFYKILLKMVAWHGFSIKSMFEDGVIPAILTPSIHLELFHTLIDLPLLTCCMEMVEPEVKLIITSTPIGGLNALAAASSLVTSVVFSAHQQSQQQQSLAMQHNQMMQFPSDGSIPSYYAGTAPPSPYGSAKLGPTSGNSGPSWSADGSGTMSFGNSQQSSFGASNHQPSLLSPTGIHIDKHRSILNVILWNEGGVVGNLWEENNRNSSTSDFSSTSDRYNFLQSGFVDTSPLAGFWNDCKITPRVLSSAEITISSIEVLLKLIIERANMQQLQELVLNLLDKMSKLFPLSTFQSRIQTILINSISACFEKCPTLIVLLQKRLIDVISEGDAAATMTRLPPISQNGANWRDELTICLVWIIGKYASPNIAGDKCDYSVMSDYDEALELLAYEKISILSMESAEAQHAANFSHSRSSNTLIPQSNSKTPILTWKEYKKAKNGKSKTSAANAPQKQLDVLSPTARLLLVLCASLTKLAARCLPLASRVKLCLAKILRHPPSQPPPSAVLRWSHHCLNILKYPSLAAHILDASTTPAMPETNSAPNKTDLPNTPWRHVDPNARFESATGEEVRDMLGRAQSSAIDANAGDLARKEFSENTPIDFAPASSFHIDQQTSLSFLLHRIDNNLRMTHDGTLDLEFGDEQENEDVVPDDLTANLAHTPTTSKNLSASGNAINVDETLPTTHVMEKQSQNLGNKLHPFVL